MRKGNPRLHFESLSFTCGADGPAPPPPPPSIPPPPPSPALRSVARYYPAINCPRLELRDNQVSAALPREKLLTSEQNRSGGKRKEGGDPSWSPHCAGTRWGWGAAVGGGVGGRLKETASSTTSHLTQVCKLTGH